MTWLIFDLDGTLCRDGRARPFPGVPTLVETLHTTGHLLFLCTLNPNGLRVIEACKLWQYFRDGRVTDYGQKSAAIYEMAANWGLKLEEALFVDDDPVNVDSCSAAGIRSILVSSVKGVTIEDLRVAGLKV